MNAKDILDKVSESYSLMLSSNGRKSYFDGKEWNSSSSKAAQFDSEHDAVSKGEHIAKGLDPRSSIIQVCLNGKPTGKTIRGSGGSASNNLGGYGSKYD